MIPLARHIEILLLEHDCVVVPGFGGFIANVNPAQYDKQGDGLYLPPYRTVVFNQQLTLNDGLLAQSYMSAYDASYPAACLQMEKDVERMIATLEETGTYTLDGVGTLQKPLGGNIVFTSHESGITTPALYGLYSFEMHSLEYVKQQEALKEALKVAGYTAVNGNDTTKDTDTKDDTGDNVIHITGWKRHWVEVAVSATAAAMLFFAFMLPAMRHSADTDELHTATAYAQTHAGETIAATVEHPATVAQADQQSANGNVQAADEGAEAKAEAELEAKANAEKAAKAEAEAEEAAKAEAERVAKAEAERVAKAEAERVAKAEAERVAKAEAERKAKAEAEKKTEANKGKFSIVMASCVSEKNAIQYVDNLKKIGFAEGRFVEGKVNRVLYSAYSSHDEAYAALAALREKSTEFSTAWIIAM